MDLRQLEYIISIADYGSINKASNAVFITQSGLNQQLLKLEKELDTQLFHRNTRELKPTQAGDIYISEARKMLKMRDSVYARIRDLNENKSGTIRIGMTHEHCIDMFIKVFPLFNKRFPGITIKSLERNVGQQQLLISKRELDIAFVLLDKMDRTNHEYIKLREEELVLGIPAASEIIERNQLHSKKDFSEIDLKDMKDAQFALMFSGSTMRNIIDPLFKTAGYDPEILLESSRNHALYEMVCSGLCCTIIPDSFAKANDNVRWFRIKGRPSWEFCISYAKETHLDNAARYFMDLSLDYVKGVLADAE